MQLSSNKNENVDIQDLSGLTQYYGPPPQGNIAQEFNTSTTITINSQSETLSNSDDEEEEEEDEKEESEEYENETPDETIKDLKAAHDSSKRLVDIQARHASQKWSQ